MHITPYLQGSGSWSHWQSVSPTIRASAFFWNLISGNWRPAELWWSHCSTKLFRWSSVPVCLRVLFVATYWYSKMHCLLFGSLTGPKCVVLFSAFIYILCATLRVNTAHLVNSELDVVWKKRGGAEKNQETLQPWYPIVKPEPLTKRQRLSFDHYTYVSAFRFRFSFSQRCCWRF
jgi:hypothetical protein